MWCCKESGDTRRRSSNKKRNKQTDQMVKNMLIHDKPERREQRSTSERVLDPKNQDKMKRRRAGVVHTNWDNFMMKWILQRLEKFREDG